MKGQRSQGTAEQVNGLMNGRQGGVGAKWARTDKIGDQIFASKWMKEVFACELAAFSILNKIVFVHVRKVRNLFSSTTSRHGIHDSSMNHFAPVCHHCAPFSPRSTLQMKKQMNQGMNKQGLCEEKYVDLGPSQTRTGP